MISYAPRREPDTRLNQLSMNEVERRGATAAFRSFMCREYSNLLTSPPPCTSGYSHRMQLLWTPGGSDFGESSSIVRTEIGQLPAEAYCVDCRAKCSGRSIDTGARLTFNSSTIRCNIRSVVPEPRLDASFIRKGRPSRETTAIASWFREHASLPVHETGRRAATPSRGGAICVDYSRSDPKPPELLLKQLRLFPGGKVPAFGEGVEMDEIVVGVLGCSTHSTWRSE